jgi:dipeptidyl aminopeptidase/acylaminoacyl peptidase
MTSEAAWRRRYRAPTISLPVWARDDPDRCIYLSNADGKYEWYAWDRRAGTHRKATDRPQGTMMASIEPTGRSIWWFDDVKGNELGRWVVQPFEGGSAVATDLPPAYATGIALGSRVSVVSTAAHGVHGVSVLTEGPAWRPLYEHREAVSVSGLARDESMFAIAHSEHGDSRNRALRVMTPDGATVAELWDGPGKGLGAGAWSRIEGDRRLIVSHERTGVSRPAIWEPESGDVNELDIDLPGEVSASWYPDAKALLLTHLWRGRTELYRLDIASASLERLETEKGVVSGARIRPDGELWFAITRSSTPPEVRCGSEVLRPPGERAPEGVSYQEIEAGDVHAWLAEPASGSRPHPTIFQIHGGPSGVDMDMFMPGVQAWVDHGCAVVMVNYRGSSGFGKAWRDAIVGKPGLLELEDIAAVRSKLVGDGVVDPSRLILAGGSWGGFLTLLGVGRQPELWSLGISGVPLADLENHYHQQSEPLQAYWRALFGGTPEQIPDVLAESSPINFASRVRVPVYILAGDNDPRCPIGQVMNYVKRMEELGAELELYRYDAGHGSMVVDEQIKQAELRLAFAAKHLGTTPPL